MLVSAVMRTCVDAGAALMVEVEGHGSSSKELSRTPALHFMLPAHTHACCV